MSYNERVGQSRPLGDKVVGPSWKTTKRITSLYRSVKSKQQQQQQKVYPDTVDWEERFKNIARLKNVGY